MVVLGIAVRNPPVPSILQRKKKGNRSIDELIGFFFFASEMQKWMSAVHVRHHRMLFLAKSTARENSEAKKSKH